MCEACYSRWWRRNRENPPICQECGKGPARARGKCQNCYMRWYRKTHVELVREIARRSKQKYANDVQHTADVRRRRAEYAQSHPDVGRRGWKKYSAKYPERKRAALRRHYQKNKAVYLEKWQKRNALKRGVSVETVRLADVIERDRGQCHLCGRKVTAATASMDHVVPLSRGGAHALGNVRLAHSRCNRQRSNRGPGQPFLL